MITDKDRIKVAKLGDQYITRGDLFRALREMPDDERPHIRTKGDLIRVLKSIIDGQLKTPLGRQTEEDLGTPLVTRQQAMQRFFAMHPDQHYELLFATDNPQAFDMSPAQWEMAKQEAELEIDKVHDQMRGDAAVTYRAMKALKEGTLAITEEDYQAEYNLRQGTLKKPEQVHFLAIRFKASEPNAEEEAANVRARLRAGEGFDDLVDEYLAKDKGHILDSDIQNKPGSRRFAGFWHTVSGAQPDDIIGPVFLPAYELIGTDEHGRPKAFPMPDAYLVLKVLEHASVRDLTLDEAKPHLMATILFAKMMLRLREENGVEIFRDKLPDPAMFERTVGDPIMGVR